MDFRQLWSLSLLSLRHFLFVIPTIKATRKCVAICDDYFGRAHHRNGKANAFRHALWNVLIVKGGAASGRSLEKSITWAKTITDWHEDFSPNKALAREMDLHNNQFGRDFAKSNYNSSQEEIVEELMKQITLSRKHTCVETLAKDRAFLVHIED